MNVIERPATIAGMLIDEAEATARIRLAYTNIIVSNAQLLYPALADKAQKQSLSIALKDKDTDPSMLYRGLIVQLNGVFENFVRGVCAAVLDQRCSEAKSYRDLDENTKNNHLHHSAKVLTYMKSGSINGIKYDFSTLQITLAKCILGDRDFKVIADVFTILMGNCTSSRLRDLFESLSLADPFADRLGEHPMLRRWANETSSRRVANLAREVLDTQIDLRNEITHGSLTKSVSYTEFNTSVQYFRALIEALKWKVGEELEHK